MQPDELVALKPQWALNRKGASSFSASKGDHHHHESDRAHYHSAFIADSRAPQPSSHRPSNSHTSTHSTSPSPSAASGSNRGSYFCSSGASGHHHSQQRDVSGSWKPSGSGNLPSSSSSPLLAPSVGASPRAAAPAPATATAAATRRNPEFSDLGQPPRQHTSDSRPAVQEATPTAGGAAATVQPDSAWSASGSSWNSSKGAAAAADGQPPLQQQRPASAVPEPASPPTASPATKQAVYQKVVFEKEFPSLKDSKHPLGYAPKEAPYKQTFLSSRVTGNWTSKLADVLPSTAVQHSVPAVAVAPAPAEQLQSGLSSKGRCSPGPGADGSTSGSGAPTPTASGWGSFAQAAGTGNGGAAGAAGANGANAAAHGLSDDKLREQLAMKQSKQLIPVIARKDDSGASSGAGRGRQTVLGGMGGGARSLAVAAATTAKVAPSASAQSAAQLSGKFLLSSGGSAVLSNGTVLLTKRAAAPLDKPLMPLAAAAAPAPSNQQEAAAGGGTAATVASGQSAVDAGGGEAGKSRVFGSDTGQPDLQQSLPRAQSAALPAKSSAFAAFGEETTGGGGHHTAGAGQWRGNGMHELLVPEQGSRQGYAVAYSALVDGVADRGAGGKVAVLLPAGNTPFADTPPSPCSQQQHAQQDSQPPAAVPAPTLPLRRQQSEQPRAAGHLEAPPSVAITAAPTSPAAVPVMPVAVPLALHPTHGNSYLAPPVPAQPEGEEPDQQALELAELASYLPGDLLAPAGDPGLDQQQEQVEQPAAAAGAKFLVPSEEEEFLRSLGWTDADDGTDDVLTEEEIAAFQASAQARACSPGLAMMHSITPVPPTPVSPPPAASMGSWGGMAPLMHGHGFASQSLFKTAAVAAPTLLGGTALAIGGSDGLLQPLGCRMGGFGALPASALAAGERRCSNTDLGYAGARSALPLAVPRGAASMSGPAANGPKRGPIAACSFGSEVSVTDSDDL